ncbi:MAG: 23S rRNA (guanosine(2251)-2'-O)-methyltransferase RlmB [Desulfonatronovibrio sp. MSAO_Bac4]|nr:MAG: 23S rRNA (guanosine(2251)-2'-O)-methyltransferase RlmB [Desulfonatronovibrio sp. MSAO_Bac4]
METNYVPGPKPVMELLSSAPDQVDTVLIKKPVSPGLGIILEKCRQTGVRFKLTSSQDLDRIARKHQGVAARIRSIKNAEPETVLSQTKQCVFPVALALDQIQDPGNLGTLARTMAALGAGGILIPKDRSAHPGQGAMKASAGALTRINLSQVTNLARTLDMARDEGYWIYGAVPEDGTNIFKIKFNIPAILILGAEEKGIRPNVLKRCHEKVQIPMPGGFDSLNVAQAGAMILGQMLRCHKV